MNIGAVILCRYNSSRLPGKILKEIDGKSILAHIVSRLNGITKLELVVATSVEDTDQPIVDFCISNNVNYFRGSLNNVSNRILNAALENEYDYFIRINGDNLFIDTSTLNNMILIAESNKYDFISNVKDRTFPYGMSIEIVNVNFYSKLIEKLNTKYYQEHVTIYLYENEADVNVKYIYNTEIKDAAGLKLAIDTEEDFTNAKAIVLELDRGLSEYSLEEIVNASKKLNE